MIELVNLVRKVLKAEDEYPIPDIGSTVYYPLWWEGLIVEATIKELQFVLCTPKYSSSSVWLYVDPEQYKDGFWCSVPKIPLEKDKLGWGISENLRDLEAVKNLVIESTALGSWAAWIDLPVGHAVWPDTDLFTNVNVPLHFLKPRKFKKRKVKEVVNRFINGGKKWLAKNHKKSIEEMQFPYYATYPERKAFWRRK